MATSAIASTDEEKRIMRHLLLSSPPGQFERILAELRTLTKESSNEAFVSDVRKEYNYQTGRSVLSSPSDVGDATGNDDEDENDPMIRSLRRVLNSRSAKWHASKDVSSNVLVKSMGLKAKRYKVTVYGERICLPNCHAGSWSGTYNIRFWEDGWLVDGKVELKAHAFEDGNVQFRSTINLGPDKLKGLGDGNDRTDDGAADVLSRSIADLIEKWDDEKVLRPLRDIYGDMSGKYLKRLRRVLPVTKTRFDWNDAGGNRLRMLLGSDEGGVGEVN